MMRSARVASSTVMIISAAAIACSGPEPGQGTTQHDGLQAGVDSAATRLLAALRTDSPDSLMALMADNVIIMPPGEPVLKGKAAVRTWYEQFVKQMRTSSLNVTDRVLSKLKGTTAAAPAAPRPSATTPAPSGVTRPNP